MVISKPFFLEFTDKGIDKKHSLGLLLGRLELDRDDIMAVGDSYNDMGMLELAGLGVCMENGRDEVKAMADHITGSNMHDGVAQAVERFVLEP